MTTTDATIDTGALREARTDVHGPPTPATEQLSRQNPSYFARVLDLTGHAWRRGPLEPRVKALILLAVDSAASHLHGPGAAEDVRRALALGATPAEVLETLELTSTMGIHAHPWEHGTLEPKVKEFIYCAFDASATHMFAVGLRQHIANAMRYGATAAGS